MGKAIDHLVVKSRHLRHKVEVGGYATGSTDFLDTFTVPTLLGIAREERDWLDDLFSVNGDTYATLALQLDSSLPDGRLGVRISYKEPDRAKEHQEFFGHDLLVTSGELFDCLPHETRIEFLNTLGQSHTPDNRSLAKLIRHFGVQTRIADLPYAYLPVPLTVGQFGSENALYYSDHVVREILSGTRNCFDNGDAFGDLHVHHSVDRKSANSGQLEIMNKIGEDYFKYPSSFDVVSFINSRPHYEAVLNARTSCTPKRTAHLVMRGIVALTPHRDPTKLQLMGTSFMDIRTYTEDREAEKRLADAAFAANDKAATIEDKVRYFDIVRHLVSDKPPDFVDLR